MIAKRVAMQARDRALASLSFELFIKIYNKK